jgi:hypothetical protein
MDRLKHEPQVRSAHLTYPQISVIFEDGIRENWVFSDVNSTGYNYLLPEDPWLGDPVPIRHEYLFNSLDDNAEQMEKLFRIDWKQWRLGNFWDQRLSIHKLVRRLLAEGWVEIVFHPDDLVNDLEALTYVNLKQRHFWDGTLHVHGRYGCGRNPGRMIVEQFTHWDREGKRPLRDVWGDPQQLFLTIEHLLKKKRSVTRHSMLCEMNGAHITRRAGDYFINPNVYRTLFKLFGLNGYVVADPDPGFGSKAIAATLAKCEYHLGSDLSALQDFLGAEFYEMDRDHYDCVLLDYHWSDPGEKVCEDLLDWEDKADVRVAYVPRRMMREVPKPDKYVRLAVSPISGHDPDFVFYYV